MRSGEQGNHEEAGAPLSVFTARRDVVQSVQQKNSGVLKRSRKSGVRDLPAVAHIRRWTSEMEFAPVHVFEQGPWHGSVKQIIWTNLAHPNLYSDE